MLHIFFWLLAISIFTFVKYLFNFFAQFLIGLLLFSFHIFCFWFHFSSIYTVYPFTNYCSVVTFVFNLHTQIIRDLPSTSFFILFSIIVCLGVRLFWVEILWWLITFMKLDIEICPQIWELFSHFFCSFLCHFSFWDLDCFF